MLSSADIRRVRLISGLYEDTGSWLADDDIQDLAHDIGAITDDVYDPDFRYSLAVECIHITLARGNIARTDALQERIIQLLRRTIPTRAVPAPVPIPGPAPSGGGLTIQQIRSMLQADNYWATESFVRNLRVVPDPTGVTLGWVLTRTASGFGFQAIGESQIEAAVTAYLEAHPIGGTPRAVFDAAVTRLQGEIDTNETKIASNTTAIATNLDSVNTLTGRVTKNEGDISKLNTSFTSLDDLVKANRGSIGIAPNNIPNAAAVVRDYVFSFEDLDVTWLNSKRVTSMEVWMKNTAFHAVDPWAPAADGSIVVNVNDTEARAIAIGASRVIPVRLVWRASGTFVALRNTWLEVGGVAGDLAAEIAARKSGDELQPETISNAAGFVSFLADQETAAETSIAHFTIAVAEDYKGVRHTYKVGDLVWFSPGSVDGKVFANIAPPDAPTEPTARKIEALNLRADPNVIAYPSGGLTAALTRTIRLIIDNPGRLDEDLWFEGEVDGQDVVARTKWTTATAGVNFVIALATARLIGQSDSLGVELQWYDAANAGNLVGRRIINVPLVKQRAVVKLANRAAYNALAAKDPDTTYYVAKA